MASSAAAPAVDLSGLLSTWPRAPQSVAETGLPLPFLEELALKTVHYGGPASLEQLGRRLGLTRGVAEEIVDGLRAGGALESDGAGPAGGEQAATGMRHVLGSRGQQRVAEALSRCRYAGVAPLTLSDYVPLARSQSLRRHPSNPAQLAAALAPFVLSEPTRRAIGRAFHSGRPALLYGASGNGKTAIIESYARSFSEAVLVPAALYAHGQVLRIFDPSVHRRVEPPPAAAGLAGQPQLTRELDLADRRWLPVRRPVVSVGGELTLTSLEFRFDEAGGFYVAPPQVKAQDGVFVVDDFGRQQVQPDELLNRWSLPLERGVDLLALQSGEQLTMPFETAVLFSTNIPPGHLAEEASLRRIPYKVQVTGPSPDELAEITRRECSRRKIAWDEAGIGALVAAVLRDGNPSPRGVFPRDLIGIIEDGARFAGKAPALIAQSIEEACRVYFVSEAA